MENSCRSHFGKNFAFSRVGDSLVKFAALAIYLQFTEIGLTDVDARANDVAY